ncbi:unnamed protein product [Anisakis simplex]|uniref:Clusterin-associated protein 1 n=1 Tax=Anisakis simplex TaxID=6269 RepID=A0A0M3J3R8_ANISI|nr:unnamed protein product [Anisakis simplex]
MSNFMSEYVNWDQFLYDLPLMVTELGKLMLFSNKRDFTLFREGVQYEYIKSPDSFRATLVQLGHSEWTALYAAHKNMDTIRLNTLSVPGIFRLIFKILHQEKSVKNQNLLRAQLDRIKHFAEENRKVCEDSIDKINATINLINEIQIATLSAQSDQKDRLNLLLKQKAEYEAKRNNTEGMLGVINNDLQNQLANVKKLERDYEEAKRRSEVNFGEVFGSAVVDILKFAPTLISTVMAPMGMPPSPQPEQLRVQKKPKQAEENEEILEVNVR